MVNKMRMHIFPIFFLVIIFTIRGEGLGKNSKAKLFKAIERGDQLSQEDFNKLIEEKSAINYKEEDSDTPLILAIKAKNNILVQWLLKAGANVNLRGGKEEVPPIVAAAEVGEFAILETLLNQKDLKINAMIRSEGTTWTALDEAISNLRKDTIDENIKVIDLLLNKGARVDLPFDGNTYPLDEVSEWFYNQKSEKNLQKIEPIVVKIYRKSPAKIQYKNLVKGRLDKLLDKLLDIPEDFFKKDKLLDHLEGEITTEKQLYLILGIKKGSFDLNVERRDPYDNRVTATPLSLLLQNKTLQSPQKVVLIKSFINNGADPEKISDGKFLLFDAFLKKEYDLVKWLVLEKKVNVNQALQSGATVLDLAVQKGHLEMVKFFLENNPKSDQKIYPRFFTIEKSINQLLGMLTFADNPEKVVIQEEFKRKKEILLLLFESSSYQTLTEKQSPANYAEQLKNPTIRDYLVSDHYRYSNQIGEGEKLANLLDKIIAKKKKRAIIEEEVNEQSDSLKSIDSTANERIKEIKADADEENKETQQSKENKRDEKIEKKKNKKSESKENILSFFLKHPIKITIFLFFSAALGTFYALYPVGKKKEENDILQEEFDDLEENGLSGTVRN